MARFKPELHPRNPKNGKFVKHSISGRKLGGGASIKRVSHNTPATKKRAPSHSTRNQSKVDTVKRKGAVVVKRAKQAHQAYGIYSDVTDIGEHGAKAAAFGATGNYLRSALHGAKVGTASARLSSTAAGAIVKRSKSIAPAKKRKFYAAQATFDRRVQAVDTVATIGLFLMGDAKQGVVAKQRIAARKAAKKIGNVQRVAIAGAKVKR